VGKIALKKRGEGGGSLQGGKISEGNLRGSCTDKGIFVGKRDWGPLVTTVNELASNGSRRALKKKSKRRQGKSPSFKKED